jgi:hypothetical protein
MTLATRQPRAQCIVSSVSKPGSSVGRTTKASSVDPSDRTRWELAREFAVSRLEREVSTAHRRLRFSERVAGGALGSPDPADLVAVLACLGDSGAPCIRAYGQAVCRIARPFRAGDRFLKITDVRISRDVPIHWPRHHHPAHLACHQLRMMFTRVIAVTSD